jgi:hypothetical protein
MPQVYDSMMDLKREITQHEVDQLLLTEQAFGQIILALDRLLIECKSVAVGDDTPKPFLGAINVLLRG